MNGESLPAPPNPNHNPDGTFAPGNNAHGNKDGVNGNEKGFQKAATRFQHYLELPREQLIAIVENKAEMNKLPQRDYLVLVTLAHGEERTKEGLKNRQEAFDRAYGKSTQIIGGDPSNPFVSPLPEKFPSVKEAAERYLAETKARPA